MQPKVYLYTLYNSFSSAKYYIEVLNTKLRFSFRFFLVSYFFLGILTFFLFHFFDLPRYKTSINAAFSELQNTYPADRIFNWDGNTLSSQPTGPVVISYPASLRSSDFPQPLAVIDTTVKEPTATVKKLQKNPLVFISDQKVFFSSGPDSWSNSSLRDLNLPGFDHSFSLTKQSSPVFFTQWKNAVLQVLEKGQFVYPFFFIPILAISRLVSLLWECFIIYYFLRISRFGHFTFLKIYQIGLHVVIIAETAQIIITHLLPETLFPTYSIVFWGFFILIFLQLKNVRVVALQKKG